MPVGGDAYCYSIDRSDKITEVDDRWVAFACENGAPSITRNAVLGHSLWEFVSDGRTFDVYERLFQKVRCQRKSVAMPFRCDSATVKREMRLVMTPMPDDGIAISCRHVHTAPQPRIALLDPCTLRSDDLLTTCSFCKRALVEGAGWIEIEEVERRLHLERRRRMPQLRYDCCDDCAALAE